ncbi:hypothetical protein EYC58_00040 [Candidatus Saccharibacteria bacterium]|nr:MAG: hypothetical protein EYC58_00040 [Candidatus Saccharibacteria bacterium]
MPQNKKFYVPTFFRKRAFAYILVIAVAAIGAYMLAISHAATNTASFTAANGTLSGNAAKISDSGATSSQAVKFSAGSTATGSVKAFDSANTVNDANWFVQAYNAGVRLYVLNMTNWGTCTPWPEAQPIIQKALAAGMKVGAYTRDPSCWHNGILAAGPYQSQLQFFALDVETDPGVKVTRAMVDGVAAMGVRPIIYSGSGMWSGVQGGNDTSFADVPLWDTDTATINFNTWQANILSPTPVKYGGWNTSTTMRVGVQQMFEYTFNGINVDLNSFDASFLR